MLSSLRLRTTPSFFRFFFLSSFFHFYFFFSPLFFLFSFRLCVINSQLCANVQPNLVVDVIRRSRKVYLPFDKWLIHFFFFFFFFDRGRRYSLRTCVQSFLHLFPIIVGSRNLPPFSTEQGKSFLSHLCGFGETNVTYVTVIELVKG